MIESQPTPISEASSAPLLELTAEAVEAIENFAKKEKSSGKLFRIAVEGGGCSGYQYAFNFDEKKDDDLVIDWKGLQVLVDPQSKLFLKGSVLDYSNDLKGSGFVVKNPNAKASCGCGVSFTV